MSRSVVRVGSHVPAKDPFGGAERRGADIVQLHLSAPRQWRAPKQRPDADDLARAGIVACVHAPYLCNPASADPAVRDKTARVLQQTLDEAVRVGAGGVVVHAGHAAGGGTLDDAFERWVDVARRLASDVPLLVENMATGQVSPGRELDDLEQLFATLHDADLDVPIGACLDTCHAFAGDPTAAEAPGRWVQRFAAAAGRIDVVHVNDSKVPAGAGRDLHQNLGDGEMGDVLAAMLRAAADAGATAFVAETPGRADGQRRDIRTIRTVLQLEPDGPRQGSESVPS